MKTAEKDLSGKPTAIFLLDALGAIGTGAAQQGGTLANQHAVSQTVLQRQGNFKLALMKCSPSQKSCIKMMGIANPF